MNKENIAHIIADPTALTVLQKCASVNELVTRLNWAGAECTREEGLRFLRTWEKMAAERESLDADEMDSISDSSGIIDSVKSMFRCVTSQSRKLTPQVKSNPLTIEMILDQMNH